MTSPVSILLLDEGHQRFDGLAAAVAVFGRGRLELVFLDDRHSVRRVVRDSGARVLVVNIDGDAEPKRVLAELVGGDVALRVVVLTDGRPAVVDAARAVDAVVCRPNVLAARDFVDQVTALAGS